MNRFFLFSSKMNHGWFITKPMQNLYANKPRESAIQKLASILQGIYTNGK